MDKTLERRMLESELMSYATIAEGKALPVPIPTAEELANLSNSDLQRLLRAIRDIVRTPTE
jgi:hypothetical protein